MSTNEFYILSRSASSTKSDLAPRSLRATTSIPIQRFTLLPPLIAQNSVPMSQWAGNFDCAGECARKRLIGSEFSKAMLEKKRKDANAKIRCKACVEAAAAKEREQVRRQSCESLHSPFVCAMHHAH